MQAGWWWGASHSSLPRPDVQSYRLRSASIRTAAFHTAFAPASTGAVTLLLLVSTGPRASVAVKCDAHCVSGREAAIQFVGVQDRRPAA